MNLNISQHMRQEQKLILTQEMQTSLKLLQMSAYELHEIVNKELEENPVLEIKSGEADLSGERETYSENYDIYKNRMLREQIDFDYVYGEFNNDQEDKADPLDFVSNKQSLKDYIREQIMELREKERVIDICCYIAENIDSRGYLSCSLKDITEDLKEDEERVSYALNLIQEFRPLGIAARDLKECLKIQLRIRNIEDNNIFRIIDECLELLAENKLKAISEKLNLNLKRVQEYCSIIKKLEPKPSRGFYTGDLEKMIIPEAEIRKMGSDLYILMNDNSLPKLTINDTYRKILKEQNDRKALEYVSQKLSSAVNMVKGIEGRKITISRILEKLIEIQREYFLHGPNHLKPMIIDDIAIPLHLHKSTVSRAIKDKYINTDFGVISLKDMFTVSINTVSEDVDMSAQVVKAEIKTLIDNENKLKPISDQAIADVLNHKGIQISRRTVAKYREEMGIRATSKRKLFN